MTVTIKGNTVNKMRWESIPYYTWFVGEVACSSGTSWSGLFYKNIKEVCHFGPDENGKPVNGSWFEYVGSLTLRNYCPVDVDIVATVKP